MTATTTTEDVFPVTVRSKRFGTMRIEYELELPARFEVLPGDGANYQAWTGFVEYMRDQGAVSPRVGDRNVSFVLSPGVPPDNFYAIVAGRIRDLLNIGWPVRFTNDCPHCGSHTVHEF